VPEVLEHDCREMGTLGFKVPELNSKGVRTEILRNYNGVLVVDHPTGKANNKSRGQEVWGGSSPFVPHGNPTYLNATVKTALYYLPNVRGCRRHWSRGDVIAVRSIENC